jgi:hypothetical protein
MDEQKPSFDGGNPYAASESKSTSLAVAAGCIRCLPPPTLSRSGIAFCLGDGAEGTAYPTTTNQELPYGTTHLVTDFSVFSPQGSNSMAKQQNRRIQI